jgi:cellulose synthase/poly-beta-1,6-N-acetylglucosamine synthase-like glycosyltransferase
MSDTLIAPAKTQEDRSQAARRTVHGARRRLAVLLSLLPLVVLLSIKVAGVSTQAFVNVYGFGVLGSTIILMWVAFTGYTDPSEDTMTLDVTSTVSCLVAVKDEREVIGPCVQSLLAQTYPHVEVIVVDDGSTDGTRELLQELALKDPRVQVILLPENIGKKRALTVAAARASGDVFLFTDSDCILAEDVVDRCLRAFQAHPGLGAVSGHVRALNADFNLLTRVQDVWYDGQFGVTKAAESVFRSVTCVSGPVAVFRREAIYNYLPAWAGDRFLGSEFRFATDRQLTGYVLGQRWTGRKLKKKYHDSPFVADVDYPEREWGVGYVRSAQATTNVPVTFKKVVIQQIRWKKSFIRNMFFTGTFYWHRGITPAALFYGHAIWVLAAPVLAFRHLIWLPLHGGMFLTLIYLCGVMFKGCVWAFAYRVQNPGDPRWVLRPLMSLLSAIALSWLLIYSACTIKRNVWVRG